MNLHDILLYHLSFLAIYLRFSMGALNNDLVPIKTGLGEISPCSVGIQLYATLNNTSDADYFVELISDECCISSDGVKDYDSLQIMGETSDVIEKGQVKTFTLVAPILDPYERIGYCIIHVDSRPIDKRNNIMRDTINIDFDTSLEQQDDIDSKNIRQCEHIDEDPLNDCKPVDCDTYYNGQKPIFDENTKRCVEVPKCRSRSKKSEDSVFDPNLNRCLIFETINNDDIDFIKSLNIDRTPKDVVIVESPDNVILNSPLYKYLLDINSTLNTNNTDTVKNKIRTKLKNKKYMCSNIIAYLTSNKYTLVVLGVVIFVQCCLICTMIYCITKRSLCNDEKKVERKYYNYRQDVSVTTPLIATSNIDTETAYDYVSESSNIEKKIKCYKSCQKERKTDPKISMSDDILSKCLNRRNWNTKPQSDITKNANNTYFNAEWEPVQSNIKPTPILKTPTEKIEKGTEISAEKVEEKQAFRKRVFKEDYSDGDSSERLIKCHDYNIQTLQVEKAHSKKAASIEKGAQAYFSNDSIDDFLSERGMSFLAGERLSKYSLSTNSASTGRSSRTSKNRNIVKNVLSYLSKKSKKYTSSDPGAKKDPSKDLELIHMSRASMYSSSGSDYKNIQGKLAKDSRSTF